MGTVWLEMLGLELLAGGLRKLPEGRARVSAIAFDLVTAPLQKLYPTPSYTNACGDIRNVLEPFGFNWQQETVHFDDENRNAVKCVLAAQAVSNAFPWFKSCVRDIRMLRIEELNDLAPAL